jgi:membrane protease YdiL (CAAX protease family)
VDLFFAAIPLFPFVLVALALFLIWLESGGRLTLKGYARELSLGAHPAVSVKRAAVLFAKMLGMLLLLSLALNALGLMDSQKVAEFFRAQPPVMIFFAVGVAPFAEELFFRGYLQKRIGILFSSVIFSLLHYAYNSVSEIIAAFFISVLIGLEMRRSKDTNACILAHAAFNALSVLLIFWFYPV